MTEMMESLDDARFAAFKGGDEQVLTSLFRSHYDALVAKAREDLGPQLEHFSSRVAVQATLVTWARRADFGNPNGLASAWEEAIREEAEQQKRKHAAFHQREGAVHAAPHVKVTSVDEAEAVLQAELHPAPVDRQKAARDAKAARRHHAAEHVQAVAAGKGWKGPALVVGGLAIAIIAGMQWLNTTGGEVVITKALASENARHLASARGQRGAVTLADSSHAKIGSDSRLTLPTEFGVTLRTLQLEGTANFTVAEGQTMPFSVRAGNAIVTATGTQFTVRAYETDSMVMVGVTEGSVSVEDKVKRKGTTVAAGEAVRVLPDGTIEPMDPSAHMSALGWVNDTLVFSDMPVRHVLAELGRWFDLKASLADPSLGDRKLSMQVPLGSSGDALNSMAAAANLAIGFDKDDKVVLSDKPVMPEKPPAKKRK